MSKENVLVGKTILSAMIADDKMAILFKTDAGDIVARTDGDCCSQSWIEHIELPYKGFPAKVVSVEDTALSETGTQGDDCTAFYGCKIHTENGDIEIDYRNASNGYYGGSLCWPDDYFYGGVYGQNKSTENWVELQS
jgi:hypothetical protein